MKIKLYLALVLLFVSQLSFAQKINFEEFGKLPVLHQGRVKPLDTFARVNLLLIYEKSSLKEMSAIEWLAELLFENDSAYKREVFRIRNKDVTKALNIEHRKTHLFSFYEVSFALKNIIKTINELYAKEPKLRTPSQTQLVELYAKVMQLFEISRSLSLLDPMFAIPTEEYAKKLSLPYGKNLNYIDISKRKNEIFAVVNKLDKKKDISNEERYYSMLATSISKIEADQQSVTFRVVPPQFSQKKESDWYSPWQTLLLGKGSPLTVKYFETWSNLIVSYRAQSEHVWNLNVKNAHELAVKMGKSKLDTQRLDWESKYNKWDLFYKSIAFYILSFLLLSFSWLGKGSLLQKLSFASLSIGFIPHFFGLVLRCYIMNRPPVSTLYESVIFVGLVSVLSAIIYERIRKNGVGVFIGSVTGIFLLFVSFGYQKEGDSMGMLAAVLNTNFWLATHVVTITIGYGCCFVASALGHVYLVQSLIQKFKPGKSFDLKTLNKNMQSATMYALFFTVLGTILGGIWADQSWGRFWGWDPKENGAMLICLWLLFVIHGRLAGYFKPKDYAAGLVLTSIIVAVAWFGVNLLNVGLHSYGFTDSIAYNLLFFSLFEIGFVVIAYALFHKLKSKAQP